MIRDKNNRYFLMSIRFNKTTPEEFGLTRTDIDNVYISIEDGSFWEKTDLYDFGWGNEYGFEKLPKLTFEELFELIFQSNIEENRYGAAAIILKKYSTELLELCMQLINNNELSKKYLDVFKILGLNYPSNRSNILGKSYQEINELNEKWREISIKVTSMINDTKKRVY